MNLPTGNFIGHWGGPHWTPYAEAIAANYQTIVPFNLPVPTTLTGTAMERKTIVTGPYDNDVLIFGAHVLAPTALGSGSNGQQVFLQVADMASGLEWAESSPTSAAPLTAYGGVRLQPMPILKLPDVFFLPRGIQMRHDFKVLADTCTGGSLTWVGVQLVGGRAPQSVSLPTGEVRVGSRIPWLAVIGIGRESLSSGHLQYNCVSGQRQVVYTSPVDCDIEIHDIAANFFDTVEDAGESADDIQFELSDNGERRFWQMEGAPAPAVMGDYRKAFPALPLCKPYLLQRNRQIEMTAANQSDTAFLNGYVVLRGVRQCAL